MGDVTPFRPIRRMPFNGATPEQTQLVADLNDLCRIIKWQAQQLMVGSRETLDISGLLRTAADDVENCNIITIEQRLLQNLK